MKRQTYREVGAQSHGSAREESADRQAAEGILPFGSFYLRKGRFRGPKELPVQRISLLTNYLGYR